MQRGTSVIGGVVVFLMCINVIVLQALAEETRMGTLKVSFLNIGQGDAIFIEAPNGRQVLIDGGPNREVLRELARVMPWYDRTIDVVIATHPDADHVSGLVDVLERYRVALFLDPGVEADTPQAESLFSTLLAEDAEHLIARRGQIIDLGNGAYLEILFPDRDVSRVETNTASIVARLVYGETAFMFTGDSPQAVERYVVRLDTDALHANVLKAGHHGSRTSSSELFVGFVNPEYVVFSRGCDNRYGHPHQEVADLMARFNISTFDTCTDGRVIFISDGMSVKRK